MLWSDTRLVCNFLSCYSVEILVVPVCRGGYRLTILVGCMQDGTVIWDGIGSNDCRVGLTVPQQHADAIRCVHIHVNHLHPV